MPGKNSQISQNQILGKTIPLKVAVRRAARMLSLSREGHRSILMAAVTTSLATAVVLSHAVDAAKILPAAVMWAGLALCALSYLSILSEPSRIDSQKPPAS